MSKHNGLFIERFNSGPFEAAINVLSGRNNRNQYKAACRLKELDYAVSVLMEAEKIKPSDLDLANRHGTISENVHTLVEAIIKGPKCTS
jgi:hypothetical protein